ncbi:MAG: hypothetical protein AAF579_00865 [Cyanobacteria bacterium P01_C01_bin.118]
MGTKEPVLPVEQALLESLDSEQLNLVAEWVATEKGLRVGESHYDHIEETLTDMSDRLIKLIPMSKSS